MLHLQSHPPVVGLTFAHQGISLRAASPLHPTGGFLGLEVCEDAGELGSEERLKSSCHFTETKQVEHGELQVDILLAISCLKLRSLQCIFYWFCCKWPDLRQKS